MFFALIFCTCVCAQTISFEQVLSQGLQNSYDRRIAATQILAADAGVEEARAAYYPQLSLRYGQEYVHVYDRYYSTVAVGDTVYSDTASKYKNSLNLSGQYDLYDFGRRHLQVAYAQQQVTVAGLNVSKIKADLSLRILDLYAQGLKQQKQIAGQTLIVAGYKRIYQLSQDLQQAGRYGRHSVSEAALALAEALTRLDELQAVAAETLSELSTYTGESYSEDTHLNDFTTLSLVVDDPDFEQLPAVALLSEQIQSKQLQLDLANKDYWPTLVASASIGMYGSDDNSYSDAVEDLSKRDASVGVTFVWAIFDGFATSAKVKRLKLELEALKLEKEQQLSATKTEYRQQQLQYESLQRTAVQRHDILHTLALEHNDGERLHAQQISDQAQFEKSRLDLMEKQLQIDLKQIDYASSNIRLALLQEDFYE